MIFTSLNASDFQYNNDFYNAEFEDLLSKIINCYHLMIGDRVKLTNNENEIRDVLLLNYLKNNTVREKIGLSNYLFDREVPEDIGISGITGRTDIKIQTLNTFMDSNAYYIIECKRLDNVNTTGITGLNAKYIENGICRFVSETYSSYYKVNGMIAFVVQELNIDENVKSINKIMNDHFPMTYSLGDISFKKISSGFNFSYASSHEVNNDKIDIYHLMFNFTENIAS